MKAYHLTLSVAAMLFCLVLAPAVSFAGDWGAIALSTRTGAWGSSWNYDEEGDARSAALRECRKHAGDCRVFKTFENACVALAGDGRGNFGWAWGYDTTSERRRRAVRQCRDQGGRGCSVVSTFCTGSAS
jgi:hypothetical protein